MPSSQRSASRRKPESASARPRVPRVAALAIAAAAGALALVLWHRAGGSDDGGTGSGVELAARYVGSAACASCHQAEADEWQPSQHARAMAEANAGTVAGRFDDAAITAHGVTSTFYRRDGRFFVRTDGADGKLAEFEIAYTFGVEPLQQYLIKMPGGRLQALSLAWDTRPAAEGGQRWFHLYPGERIAAGDPLHWTGPQQNWNFMCADCHSTNVRKGYDGGTREYTTTWSEISVGCEACHGPGSTHVERARAGEEAPGAYGLAARLSERRAVTWTWDPAARVPIRSAPKTGDAEIEVCARCHARRAQLTDAWQAGDRFEDGFRPSLLDERLFHPDGQQQDEVYTHASFLQSRMYAAGVTCSDCHNPHSGELRRTGNATCTQCHGAERYDTRAHHLHDPGTTASACVTCHMPATTYMVVDPRRDHSFSVPRPDRTLALGVPNACTSSCHVAQGAAWAARQLEARLEARRSRSNDPAEAFSTFDRGAAGGAGRVARIATDATLPAIVRASALGRLAGRPQPADLPLQVLVADPSPTVRRSALAVVALGDESLRLALAPALLSDPVRTVRIEAARALVEVADRALTGPARAAFDRAFDELVSEQRFQADRPEAQTNLGSIWRARGRLDEAERAFREAIGIDPTFDPAYVNLAELHRTRGDETRAEEILREAVRVLPASAAAHHALGLSLVRQQRRVEALPELAEAARLDPAVSRYAYVYGVALHDTNRSAEAMRVLTAAHARHPDDPDLLLVLAIYSQEIGRTADARRYVTRLLQVDPANPNGRSLSAQLGEGRP